MLPTRDDIDTNPILLSATDQHLYMQKVGAINYLAVNTRPDIAFAVGWVARKMKNPTEFDMNQVNRILSYIFQTKHLGLTFTGQGGVVLSVYVDASYAIHDDRKSHFGICMFIGNFSASIATKSKKAKCMAISSTEAEYLALCEGAKLVAWARQLLSELGYPQPGPTVVYEDNQSTIRMVNNGNDKGRTKHIDVRFHYIREMIEKGYLCDYTITVPIFNHEPTYISVCKYLINNLKFQVKLMHLIETTLLASILFHIASFIT
jgi:hypothetical protein